MPAGLSGTSLLTSETPESLVAGLIVANEISDDGLQREGNGYLVREGKRLREDRSPLFGNSCLGSGAVGCRIQLLGVSFGEWLRRHNLLTLGPIEACT